LFQVHHVLCHKTESHGAHHRPVGGETPRLVGHGRVPQHPEGDGQNGRRQRGGAGTRPVAVDTRSWCLGDLVVRSTPSSFSLCLS
jgi:hypothetical protein